MAGGARLGVGYSLLVLGLVLATIGGILTGFSFQFSETECHDGGLFGPDHCEREEASMNAHVLGTWMMIPATLFVVASIPLIVTGHTARDREREHHHVHEHGTGELGR